MGRMGDEGVCGCPPDEWATQQTSLLELNVANFDRIVSGLNSNAVWANMNRGSFGW
jgi:hypothetical protein